MAKIVSLLEEKVSKLNKPGRHCIDSSLNLYLDIRKSGHKAWIVRKENTCRKLANFDSMSLENARLSLIPTIKAADKENKKYENLIFLDEQIKRYEENLKKIDDRIKSSRKKLIQLKINIEIESRINYEKIIDDLKDSSIGIKYPKIPKNVLIKSSKYGDGLPPAPGIYFLWNNDIIEYIGKSIRLDTRVRIGTHHVLNEYHKISYLLFPFDHLDWAECFYIGYARPIKNFGY